MSNSQLDRLGERLRHGSAAESADLALLDEYVNEHRHALERVSGELRERRVVHCAGIYARLAEELGVGLSRSTTWPAEFEVVELTPASRFKNPESILEKLRRERGMRLSRMQDIAGTRLVVSGGLIEQELVARAILDRWPAAKTSDRRLTPSYGYRALHVVVQEGARRVEIQIRTLRQDQWAQAMEEIGDRLGRGVRYGEPAAVPSELLPQVDELLEEMFTLSEKGQQIDRMRASFALIEMQVTGRLGGAPPDLVQKLDEAEVLFRRLDAAYAEGLPVIIGLAERLGIADR